jgi:hypothetical protein
MPTPTKVTTVSDLHAITGSPERVLDRSADGTLWLTLAVGDDAYMWYSKDQGTTWSYAGSGSEVDVISTYFPRGFHIDSDGYAHLVGRDDNTELIYARGTPNSTQTAWSWKTIELAPASEALAPDGGIDLVAFRLGTGWKAWVLVTTTAISGGVTTNTMRLTRVDISSSGSLSSGPTEIVRSTTGFGYPFGCLTFQHTGDGKTATATPHVYITSAINTPDTTHPRQDALQMVKHTYSAGAWVQAAAATLDAATDCTGRTMRSAYDGSRLIVAYGTRDRTVGTTSAAVKALEWVEAAGTVTQRNPPAYAAGYPLGTSLAIDPTSADAYVVAYGETNDDPQWVRFARASTAWGAWATIGTASMGGAAGRASLKRFVAKSAIEAVYLTGTSSPYTVNYVKLTSVNQAPSPPTLLSPSPSSVADLATYGAVFSWQFIDPDPGDTQSAWQMRRKVGAGAYSYYTAVSQTWGVTAVWNTGSALSVPFGPGVWTNGSTWQWSVNTQDSSGLASGFSPDATVVATTAPVIAVTDPQGIYSIDSSPIIVWTYTGANQQRTWQLRLFDIGTYSAVGFDPATSSAVWDSGEVSSSIQRNVRVGAVLLNNQTYRAYMRVSDTVSLYSGWAYTEFLLVLTPAPAPALATVVEQDYVSGLPRVRLTVQGLTNMLTASQSYGHTDTANDWVNDANCTAGSATSGMVVGNLALKMTAQAAGSMSLMSGPGVPPLVTTGLPQPATRDFPVAAGQTYTALASFSAATTVRLCQMNLRWYNTADTLLATTTGIGVADLAGFPTQMVTTGVAPLGADRVRLVLQVSGAASGEVHYADGIDLHPGTSTVAGPGGLVATQSFTVTATLPDGTTYPVRAAQSAAANTTQYLVGYDREMPFATDVLYQAQASSLLASGQPLASDLSASALVNVPSDVWGLRDPLDPAGEVVGLVTDFAVERAMLGATYHTAGRRFPIVEYEGSTGDDAPQKGSFLATGVTTRRALRSLLARPTPLLLQSPSGDFWYVWITDQKVTAVVAQSQTVDVMYVEVAAP